MLTKAESNNGVPANAGLLFCLLYKRVFRIVWIRLHFTSGDFFVRRAVVTEFANSQAPFRAGTNRRSKSPAGHRTSLIKIAKTSGRIESGAGFIVREVLKPAFRLSISRKYPRVRIAGKLCCEPSHRFPGPLMNPQSTRGIGGFELGESLTQP